MSTSSLPAPLRRATLPSPPPPRPPKSPRRPPRALALPLDLDSPSSSSRPLSSAKAVLSARLFQERHTLDFAHLHDHPDPRVREARERAEQERLDEERRRGREKRRSMMIAPSSGPGEGGWQARSRNNENDDRGHARTESLGGGFKPLNLVKARERRARAQSQDLTTTSRRSTSLSYAKPDLQQQTTQIRAVTNPETSRRITSTLDVVVEQDTSPPPSPHQSLPASSPSLPAQITKAGSLSSTSATDPNDTSQSGSTYSWATSFSGETAELRLTATYVPPVTSTSSTYSPDLRDEEVLDTPDKKTQRRKRIVALAHTVRQLEGVGSRIGPEDGVYEKLVKAWNDRNGLPSPGLGLTDAPPPLLSPTETSTSGGLLPAASLPPTPHFPADLAPPPFVPDHVFPPDETSSTVALRKFPLASSHTGPAPPLDPSTSFDLHSPLSPEFTTPSLSQHAHLPQPRQISLAKSSDGSSRRSVRYSYASTLHDLALEGGLAHGERIFEERRWMRGSGPGKSGFGTTLWSSGDFDTPPMGYPAAFDHVPNADGEPRAWEVPSPKLDSPIALPQGEARTLRRQEGRVQAGEGSGGWGLGLGWPARLPAHAEAARQETEGDFRRGEDMHDRYRQAVSTSTTTTTTNSMPGSSHCGGAVADDSDVVPDDQIDGPSEYRYSTRYRARDSQTRWGISSPLHHPQAEVPVQVGEQEVLREDTIGLALSPPEGAEVVDGLDGSATSSLQYPPSLIRHLATPARNDEEQEMATPAMPTVPVNYSPAAVIQRESQRRSFANSSSPAWWDSTEAVSAAEGRQSTGEARAWSDAAGRSERDGGDLEKGATVKVGERGGKAERAVQWMFFLGFLMPLLWIVAGWCIPVRPSTDGEEQVKDEEVLVEGATGRVGERRGGWLFHAQPWIRRCRIATVVGGSALVGAGIAAGVVFAVTH